MSSLGDGKEFSLYVDGERFSRSVHGAGTLCVGCHTSVTPDNHPQDGSVSKFKTAAEYRAVRQRSCQKCHPADYAQLSTSAHYLSRGGGCLTCHGNKGLSSLLGNGEELTLFVDQKAFRSSVHGAKATCLDCHVDIYPEDHPRPGSVKRFPTHRDYTLARYEACKRCHFSNYTKLLESVHYQMLSQGNVLAPVCTDCHGVHDIGYADRPRYNISRKCAPCHQEVYETYARSVHGRALEEEHNLDVPVCTSCHMAHVTEDPRRTTFLMRTPELCGQCHADAKLMRKYGLSSNVLQTYLADFHGVSITFYKKEKRTDPSRVTAVCTDCHGIHDITKTSGAEAATMKARLLENCRKCHPDATANFPDAWISHYEPTLSRAPLVVLVKVFYAIMIPFVIIGLIFNILFHIWRLAVNR
jgi:predicted CXXCH cytochrome family protein